MQAKIVSIKCILFTLLHFLVDGICALLVFNYYYQDNEEIIITLFVLYNGLAFMLQPLFGWLIDKFNLPKVFLGASVILLLIGSLCRNNYIVGAILIGLGNAIFHIAGGKYVICETQNNIVYLGLFVSLGAIGLAIGQWYASDLLLYIFLGSMIVLSLIIMITPNGEPIGNEKTISFSKKEAILFVLLSVVVVFIRAFVGKIIPMTFEKTTLIILILAICQAVGKFLGGLLTKLIGPSLSIILTLSLSILFMIFGSSNVICMCFGVMLFNCSMPITLYYSNVLLKKKEGLAFGLLAFVLFPGYALGLIGIDSIAAKWLIGVLTLSSMALVLLIIRRVNKKNAIPNCY